MFHYNLLLFLRNIRHQKLFTIINLSGLTAGIVSTLLIYLYVQHELSFDRFHTHADKIYRINQTFIWGENDPNQFASLGPGVAHALAAEIPEVKEVTRIHPPGNVLVSYTNLKNEAVAFDQDGILAVDSNFFRVFTYPLLSGNPETALKEPNGIVITTSAAKKYFGDEEPMGKLLQISNLVDNPNSQSQEATAFAVTGVVNDPPDNSYIQYDMLVSMNSLPRVKRANWTWMWTMFETFVLLEENASVEALKEKVSGLPRKYADATLQRILNQTFEEYEKSGKKWELFVQPFTSIHLHSSNVYNRVGTVGNITTLYVLMGVEVFIILLSCINFMNLSTAQYTRRIKESSLRKILGSDRSQLAFHFFTEAFLFCMLAAVIGLGLTQILLPFFNALTTSDLHLNLFGNGQILVALVGLIIVMSVLAGSYPAIFLSAFPPAQAMKGKVRAGKKGKNLRNGLVAFQFIISMVLLVCTMVVFQQLKFLSEKEIGFNRENLLVIKRLEWVNDKETFLHTLQNIPGIEIASWCTSVPPRLYDGDQFKAEGAGEKVTPLNYVNADEQYIPALKLELIVGRNFSKDRPSDKEVVVLNETAVREFGWTADESVLGKKIEYPGMGKQFEVVGVLRDFNYWTLNAPIQPMALFHVEGPVPSNNSQFTVMRIAPTDQSQWPTVIGAIEKQWKEYAGDAPFQYEFVDQAFAASFKSEEQFGKALTVFAALAILIASFGLLGMIIYTLEQRTKEIGIRKVVGASVGSIWVLVIKEYAVIIGIAIVVSTPFCLWVLSKWLESFAYRVTITPWIFVIAGAIMLITSILITSYHVVRAALTNPVTVLKDE
ncbi:MAG: ABC transporter permease [Cyclobacteriaceae bacterium]|nr:ABC transporter permease [Cyclobacteriaceae bacterium]